MSNRRKSAAVDPFQELYRNKRVTRSMSRCRDTYVPPPQPKRPKKPLSGRKGRSYTWDQLVKQGQRAAWAYAHRDRTGEPDKIFIDYSDIDIIEGGLVQHTRESLDKYIEDSGFIFPDHSPLTLKDFDHAMEVAPDKTVQSVLEIVVRNATLPQRDLYSLLLTSCWIFNDLESVDSLWLSLDLCGMNKAGDRLLAALSLPRYHNVEHINLESAQDIKDKHLELLKNKCKKSLGNLISINLNGCQHVSDKGVNNITSSCPKLTHFSISENSKVTDLSIMYLVKNCKFLKDLNLKDCKNVTDKVWVTIIHASDGLQTLGVNELRVVGAEQWIEEGRPCQRSARN